MNNSCTATIIHCCGDCCTCNTTVTSESSRCDSCQQGCRCNRSYYYGTKASSGATLLDDGKKIIPKRGRPEHLMGLPSYRPRWRMKAKRRGRRGQRSRENRTKRTV